MSALSINARSMSIHSSCVSAQSSTSMYHDKCGTIGVNPPDATACPALIALKTLRAVSLFVSAVNGPAIYTILRMVIPPCNAFGFKFHGHVCLVE